MVNWGEYKIVLKKVNHDVPIIEYTEAFKKWLNVYARRGLMAYEKGELEYEQQVASATAATEAAAEAKEDEEEAAGIHSGRRKNFLDTSSSGSDDEAGASGSE